MLENLPSDPALVYTAIQESRVLVDCYFSVNYFQVTGNTPLMYAAMENRTILIERMIEMGCDIHAKNKEHYTTLHLASMYSREDTVKLLLSKKADPSNSGGVSH